MVEDTEGGRTQLLAVGRSQIKLTSTTTVHILHSGKEKINNRTIILWRISIIHVGLEE